MGSGKIRIWDETQNKMTYFEKEDPSSTAQNVPNFTLMHSTGFKDEGGTEIYESDVLYDSERNFTFTVSHLTELNIDKKHLHHLTVMGNVYENPELFTEWGE